MQMDSRVEVMPGGREDEGSGGGFLKRGTKREASETDLNDLDRFEKRLRMLSLRKFVVMPPSSLCSSMLTFERQVAWSGRRANSPAARAPSPIMRQITTPPPIPLPLRRCR